MPNVNLTDSRQRDAVVKAESTGVAEDLRYVDSGGNNAYTRKILKATVDHDYSTLVEKYEDDKDKLAQALVDGDPEVDMEKCGLFLWGVSKVYVDSEDGIVYRIEQTEIVRDPNGNVREKRSRQRSEANVDMEIPLTWTGRKIDKGEAVRRFVFSSKMQIVHINGLTYDFLFGMASELAESNSLMMIGGGSKGRDPLIFRSGSIPYRGFLEGRVDGDKYILLLHLSNMELKQFADAAEEQEEVKSETGQSSKAGSYAKKDEKIVVETQADKVAESVADEKLGTDTDSKNEKPGRAEATTDKGEQAEAPDKKLKKSKNKKTKAKKSDEKNNKNKKEKSETNNTSEDRDGEKSKPDSAATKEAKVAEKPKQTTVSESTEGAVSSQDLGVWLKSIRMGKYLQVFVENEIDVDVLSELTDADLKELDIPLGSRRRLLKAVSEADNLRAEVVMAVQTMSGTKTPSKD